MTTHRLRVALVGPCAVGKSTLSTLLRRRGWEVSQPAQEHSGVPDMWQRLVQPDVLIYLDASPETLLAHRPHAAWEVQNLEVQSERLAHARGHADLVLCVDGQVPEATMDAIESFLRHRRAQRIVPKS